MHGRIQRLQSLYDLLNTSSALLLCLQQSRYTICEYGFIFFLGLSLVLGPLFFLVLLRCRPGVSVPLGFEQLILLWFVLLIVSECDDCVREFRCDTAQRA